MGIASWYRWHSGEAAAGPALRHALGPGWRGQSVRVCGKACVTVRLTDWCACHRHGGDERLIDLDMRSYARLADPNTGLTRVIVFY